MIQKLSEIICLINFNKGISSQIPVDESTHLRDDLGFDSLDLAELTVRIQREFKVDVFEDGIVNTVAEILEKLHD